MSEARNGPRTYTNTEQHMAKRAQGQAHPRPRVQDQDSAPFDVHIPLGTFYMVFTILLEIIISYSVLIGRFRVRRASLRLSAVQ